MHNGFSKTKSVFEDFQAFDYGSDMLLSCKRQIEGIYKAKFIYTESGNAKSYEDQEVYHERKRTQVTERLTNWESVMQELELKKQNIQLGRQTMANWVMKSAAGKAQPI